jgi:hypothetical protein
MVGKSKKNIEVEEWVDAFIKEHNEPPTYSMIEKQFNIKRCAAWNRCEKFRGKMRAGKKSTAINLKKMSVVELRIAFEREFTNRKMSVKELQGAEKVWVWIADLCGGI